MRAIARARAHGKGTREPGTSPRAPVRARPEARGEGRGARNAKMVSPAASIASHSGVRVRSPGGRGWNGLPDTALRRTKPRLKRPDLGRFGRGLATEESNIQQAYQPRPPAGAI